MKYLFISLIMVFAAACCEGKQEVKPAPEPAKVEEKKAKELQVEEKKTEEPKVKEKKESEAK